MDNESVYSYDAEDAEQFIKNINGRAFNALNKAYMLPSDEPEWQRLDKQHVALTLAMGSLTPCPEIVDSVLAQIAGEERRVLDIGCGAGTWALEMAKQYPHCSVVGVDLAPPPLLPDVMPKNLRFEIDNVNYGLKHFYGYFDIVHAKSVVTGINNYGELMDEATRCLKPGGLVIFIDGDPRILSVDRLHPVPFPGQESAGQVSWFRKIIHEASEACKLAGSNLDLADQLLNQGLWNHPMCDPETAVAGTIILPIGPWATVPDVEQSQRLYYIGSLMRQNFISMHRAMHSRLLELGLDQWTLDHWSARADEELISSIPKTWVRFRFMWARRRAGPNLPAPALPMIQPLDIFNMFSTAAYPPHPSWSHPPTANLMPSHNAHYPYINFFYSANGYALDAQRRMRADTQYPPSDVRRAWAMRQSFEATQVAT